MSRFIEFINDKVIPKRRWIYGISFIISLTFFLLFSYRQRIFTNGGVCNSSIIFPGDYCGQHFENDRVFCCFIDTDENTGQIICPFLGCHDITQEYNQIYLPNEWKIEVFSIFCFIVIIIFLLIGIANCILFTCIKSEYWNKNEYEILK
jgi:hypothetical protein